MTQRRKIVTDLLRPAVTQAVQLEFDEQQLTDLVSSEYQAMLKQRERE